VFYFGILADDTPPVGLAAYAAAAISRGDPIKTGIIGFSYDIRTALLPFMFIFNTDLLLIDVGPVKAVFVFCISLIAMLVFAAVTQGYFIAKTKKWEAVVLILIVFMLFPTRFLPQPMAREIHRDQRPRCFDRLGRPPDGVHRKVAYFGSGLRHWYCWRNHRYADTRG
jgi:TRAP-type uncharacterized transport system fused permease subunit